MTAVLPLVSPRAERGDQRRHRQGRAGSAGWLVAEVATSVLAALLLTWLGSRIHVDPMDRIGQVSGLAAIQLRLLVLLGVTAVLYTAAARLFPRAAIRVAAAAVAGLATGVTAAGQAVALHGTTWPLYAQWGDAGVLQRWAYAVIDGQPLAPEYPPGFPKLLAWTAQLFFDGDVPHAMKWLNILFIALTGPAAYLSWRLLLRPLWALGIGVTASLPLVEPYKPYSPMVLIVVIPVIAKLVDVVQRSAELSRRAAIVRGAGLGVLLALMFLLYSGWFVWSAVGVVVVAVIVLVQLRRAQGTRHLVTGLLALAASLVTFLALAGSYLVSLLGASGNTKDAYLYFDTMSDPAYFAMWGSSTPGPQKDLGWPPLGELGGVGVFPILLVVGLGFAMALGIRRAVVLSVFACTASAFLLRYWYASHMYRDKLVQLYPRTSIQILYCMIVLTGLACMLAADRVQEWVRGRAEQGSGRRMAGPRAVAVGSLCSLGLLFGMAGSATANTYMPETPAKDSPGQFAWISHVLRQPNGECPKFSPKGNNCEPYVPPQRVHKKN